MAEISNSEFLRNPMSYENSLQNGDVDHYQNISDLSTDGALRYIDKMLMDEAMYDDTNELLESSDFQVKERSFYEVLGQQYPTDPFVSESEAASQMFMDEAMYDDTSELLEPSDFQAKERSFYEVIGQEYPTDPFVSESEAASQMFWKGVDEAKKFLPSNNDDPTVHNLNGGDRDGNEKVATSKKKIHTDDEFDTWTFVADETCEELTALITDLRNASKEPRKRTRNKKGGVDLRSLLLSCAQAISDHHHMPTEILTEIRDNSFQFGDANQRVSYYMLCGLQARFAGTGKMMHKAFAYDKMSASDYFTAYCTSFIYTSFKMISIFASNKMIAVRSKKYARVHIIDFGILYGFQWPALIQRLADREGGPPKLRITGIDYPQPGREPEERIRATRNRLVHYAEMFGVPFEYNAILKSWESIRVEDLAIEEGEFVAVNCLFRAENLMTDDVVANASPRSTFLDLIRKINPGIFVNGVSNGGYGVPYFLTRFREAFFHFSALFDMIETIIPKGRPERELLESILGNEAINVVACEGWERLERPETCSQWRQRLVRAGLKQVRLERSVLRSIVKKVKNSYHKEFVVDEDNKWLMMSWKGRIICALSCWQPAAV